MGTQVPGRRAFIAGAVVLFMFGAVHLLAVYKGNFVPPEPGPMGDLDRMAKEIKQRMGPFEFSAFGLIQLLSASYSVLLLYAGTVSLVSLGPSATQGRLRGLTVVNLLLAILMLGLTIVYQFPPPMLFAAVATVLFSISLFQQRRPVHGQVA
jgi:hypothetical protein